ncbi:translation elongation factor Ts [Candidatus Peregrinibacteria bacterium]|nr:translation elongation factor Ts [Candidatus Peregrinibacteria bacterium]
MAVTIEEIKKLRETTGVSMTACKTALEEAGGDFEKAIDILRMKGEAKAADRAGRSTGQGAIVVKSDGKKSAMVTLLCETDFVARGDDFLKIARDLPDVKEAVLKLGENVQVGEMKIVEGDNVGNYVHSNRKIGVLVSLQGGSGEIAKDIAMHIAATNPEVISPDEVSADLLEREKGIWREQLKNEDKPAEIVEKIMIGKEKKFREENALIKQIFVKDPEKTIEQLLKEADAIVKEFKRFAI